MAEDWGSGDKPAAAATSAADWGSGDKPAAGQQPGAGSRLWSSFVDALPHPIDALKEWANRPSEVGKAMDGLHELNQLDKQAAADPQNQGKPRNQWVMPSSTRAQKDTIERGMNAQIGGSPDGNALTDLAGPGGKAAKQFASGDYAGGSGTLLGGYGAPVALGAAGGAAIEAAPTAARVAKAAVKAGGADVAAGTAKVAGAGALGYAASQMGPFGQGLDAVAGMNELSGKGVIGSGLKQAGRGLKAGYDAGKAALAPAPAPAPVRTPIWTGPSPAPAAVPEFTGLPGKLPSGRVPGAPAIDTTTGQVLSPAAPGEFRAPQVPPATPPEAAPAANPEAVAAFVAAKAAKATAAVNPAKAAFDAAQNVSQTTQPASAEPQVRVLPPTPTTAPAAIIAKARDAKVGTLADTLEGQISAADAARMSPGEWERLSKGLGINTPSPTSVTAVIDELKTRAAKKAAPAAEAPTMMTPSLDYLSTLKNNPRALAIAQKLAAQMSH